MAKTLIDQIVEDIKQAHVILNAKNGHGKSSSLMTIIKHVKEDDPRTIIKVFDVSYVWFHRSPLKWRQIITIQDMTDFVNGLRSFYNVEDCVYEMGDLTDELRRFFVALLIKQDYEVRRKIVEQRGLGAIKEIPRIIYVFEESDTYFSSASLNKRDEAGHYLSDFIKVGRNFGLRAFCVTTAEVGELGTKLRRRAEHLIGRIISDSDRGFFNRKSKGLGIKALGLPRFHWIYFNGSASEMFRIRDEATNIPENYTPKVAEKPTARKPIPEENRVNIRVAPVQPIRSGVSWRVVVGLIIITVILAWVFL